MELVDQHSEGVHRGELGLGTFEACLQRAAGARGPAPRGVTFFDAPLGRAIRRWCPPLLGLDPHCPPPRYLARRRELGALQAGRRLLRGSGITTFLLDAAPAGPDRAGELAAVGQVHELVRLESLARQVAAGSGTVDAFLRDAAEAVHAAGRRAVAFAVGVPDGPDRRIRTGPELRRGVGQLLRTRRLPAVLARHLLWSALGCGIPVQLHGGDPARLTGLAEATSGAGADLVLLPSPRHSATAARLAADHPHVYADTGPDPRGALRVAPAGKLLFSTGAQVLPELYVVAARTFTRALERLTGEWLAEGVCSAGDADRSVAALTAGTARRIYGIGPDADPRM